ncbi:hypothetical protein ABHN05_11680 [Brevibacillus laterosporus]|uniref:hypothetical protein n=1 Tax=Brevibacillus laterosporus TaxID=1465 RepID=UPI00112BA560|nr:hypothetical protein [Brevibacillus laterosporus]MBG9804634.1 hypothetical protein [Brevibacillus laterosporus]MED4764931.1 hypothetical protein [Brevibacillus laterosporus]TPH21362.1 hypothetical protein EGH09_03545 [Brevibacillus laterosporus]
MTQDDIHDWMQRDLDDDLSVEEKRMLQAKLAENPEYMLQYERLQKVSDGLANLPRVTPPFSIVDALLPQLEQSRVTPEPAAVTQTAPPRLELKQKQDKSAAKNRRLPLWMAKVGSGVAAACLLLGIFVMANKDKNETIVLTNGASGHVQEEVSKKSSGDLITKDVPKTEKPKSTTSDKNTDVNEKGQNSQDASKEIPVSTPDDTSSELKGNQKLEENKQEHQQNRPNDNKSDAENSIAMAQKDGHLKGGNQTDGNQTQHEMAIAPTIKDNHASTSGKASAHEQSLSEDALFSLIPDQVDNYNKLDQEGKVQAWEEASKEVREFLQEHPDLQNVKNQKELEKVIQNAIERALKEQKQREEEKKQKAEQQAKDKQKEWEKQQKELEKKQKELQKEWEKQMKEWEKQQEKQQKDAEKHLEEWTNLQNGWNWHK